VLAPGEGVWLPQLNEKSGSPGTNFAERAVSVSAVLAAVPYFPLF